MTLIDTALSSTDPESPPSLVSEGGRSDDFLTISIHGTSNSVTIPSRPTSAWLLANTTLEQVQVWDVKTDGYVYSEAINNVFNSFFDKPVKLVYKGPTPRILRGSGAPAILGREESTNFPDVMPLLIANEKSIDELNERLTRKGRSEITIERFRANIVIRGAADAWSEDDWKTVRISSSQQGGQVSSGLLGYLTGGGNASKTFDIDVQSRCARCQVPNVDPDTAVKDKHEPWDTLVSYRRIDEGHKYKPCFGMLAVTRKEGEIEVGMKFEVLQRTDQHRYLKGF